MRFPLTAAMIVLATLTGCSDSGSAKLEAEVAKAAQAKAEAELAAAKAEAELAKVKAQAAQTDAVMPEDETVPVNESATKSGVIAEQSQQPKITEEQIVEALKRGVADYQSFVDQSKFMITELRYDVQKSTSLVSPYVAIVSYKSCTSKTLQDNRYAWKEHQDTLGWQNGRWVATQRLMRSLAYDRPLKDATSKEFLKVDKDGQLAGGYVMDELFDLQDKAFSSR
ncbi:MAG TPA: hypothetical protein VM165_02955 [Planctomycetaceae bacterium]|nr:hypothetical protein [Planctomycetaceae bacterium]